MLRQWEQFKLSSETFQTPVMDLAAVQRQSREVRLCPSFSHRSEVQYFECCSKSVNLHRRQEQT